MRVLSWVMVALLIAVQPVQAAVMVGFGVSPLPPGGPYSDDFSGTDGTALATHNSYWSGASTTYVVGNLKILGNAVSTTGAFAAGGAYHTESVADSTEITYVGLSNTTQSVNKFVGVRMDGSSLGYNARPTFNSGNWVGVKISKNTTAIGTDCTGLSLPVGSDYVFKITASGTSTVTITVYIDDTQVCQKTDSSSTITSGHPGFFVQGNGTIDNTKFDNWTEL